MVIPVVLATDRNFLPYMMVAVESIIQNANVDDTYNIFIFNEELDDSDINVVNAFMKSERQKRLKKVFIEFINVKDRVTPIGFTDPGRNWSSAAYYRFLIPELLPQFDKVIYLDCDVLCCSDLGELYRLPKWDKGELVAAVEDIYCENCYLQDLGGHRDYFEQVLEINNQGRTQKFYFNTGVMVLNCRELKNAGIIPNMMEMVKGFLKYIDQDAFNKYCKERVEWLDYRWNAMSGLGKTERFGAEMNKVIMEALANPGILHITPHKPWKRSEKEFCYMRELWWNVARETPYYEAILTGYLFSKVEKVKMKYKIRIKIKNVIQKSRLGQAILFTYGRTKRKRKMNSCLRVGKL